MCLIFRSYKMLYFFVLTFLFKSREALKKSFYKKFTKSVGYIKKSSTFALTNNG